MARPKRAPEPCSVDGCDRLISVWKHRLCSMHYHRWQRHADPTVVARRPNHSQPEVCVIEGCTTRAHSNDMCQRHYKRWKAHGDPLVEMVKGGVPRRFTCSVPDCDQPHKSDGYCAKHHARWYKHGDADTVLPNARMGPDNNRWKGDDVGEGAIHCRLRVRRGKATEHACVDCGDPADHWSFSHQTASVILIGSKDGKPYPYSTNLDDYDPRCKSCHVRYDAATPWTLALTSAPKDDGVHADTGEPGPGADPAPE